MSRIVPGMASVLVPLVVLGLAVPAAASEFPERECCDSIPPLPAQFTTPPVSVATSSSRSTSSTQSTTAVQLGSVTPIINCKMARSMCVNDDACHSIATLIPRLCGQELVACSTVTVTKCTAALRTLVSFQFFQPTCLCKEQRVDPECYTYRNLVFDHPCFTVQQKAEDPYPVNTLLTCQYALDACREKRHCSRLYDNFVRSCHSSDSSCLMTDSRACYDAWNELRISPVFGCICPTINDECQRIFDRIHHNPCIDDLPEHRHNTTWHSTHYRLHRLLLLPPRSAPPTWRRPFAPALPAPPASRTPARSRTVASSQPRETSGAAGPTQGRFSVNVLAGGGLDGDRRPADPMLVTPLFDHAAETAHNSTLVETLYGPPDPLSRGRGRTANGYHRQPPRYHHVSSVGASLEDEVISSTCHEARAICLDDQHCRSKLEPVLSACGDSHCNRKICMQRLQNFYRAVSTNLAMEVAFCVCRRSSDGGECEQALDQLHPRCAQRPERGMVLACQSVAEQCRNDPSGSCRPRLEHYEQACAVDYETNMCAGPTADCRAALIAVLGTELRTNCSCTGTPTVNNCLGWKKLLFENACVVQAQYEFHGQRQEYLRTPPPPPALPPSTPTAHWPATVRTTPRQWRPTAATASTARITPRRTTTAGTTTTARRRHQERPHCVVRKEGRPVDRILVGEGIRYYTRDSTTDVASRGVQLERDCSELCMCHPPGRETCNVLVCAEKKECRTAMATYHDGSAGLLPYRAGCICFHGNFVCMRPPSDRYTLPFGVFLFLGYSQKEERLLQQYTRKTVRENTVEELGKVLQKITQRNEPSDDGQKWPCKLSVKQVFPETENIIIQAKIDDVEDSYNNSLSKESLDKEKRECAPPLHEISIMINDQEPVVLSHPLLSVFKMADVEVTIPDTSGSWRCADSAAELRRLVLVAAVALVVR